MTPPPPEFSRTIRVDSLSADPQPVAIEADAGERAALARRFGLVAIDRLRAQVEMTRAGATIDVHGKLEAAVVQSCVASGVPIEAAIDAPFAVQFAPPPSPERGIEEEIELGEEDCDTIFYTGPEVDVGEAVAETLLLSLDPWPRAPGSEEILREAGIKSEEEIGSAADEKPSPFAALAELRDKLNK